MGLIAMKQLVAIKQFVLPIFSPVSARLGLALAGALMASVAQASERVAKAYPAKDFSELVVTGNAHVEITQNGSEYLRIETSPEVMERVKVDQTGKRLSISVKHKGGIFDWFRSGDDHIQVILHVKQLSQVELAGAARARVGDLQGDSLRFEGSGAAAGDFKAVNVQNLVVGLSGASNVGIAKLNAINVKVELSGASNLDVRQASSAQQLGANVSGASSLRARVLSTAHAELDASGASRIEVTATHRLRAHASGASVIDYFGNPKAETNSNGASHINARND